MKAMSANHRPKGSNRERGTTYLELSMMSLIAGILLVSLAQAMRSTTLATIVAKERARAQALAQDRLEEVKNFGFNTLAMRFSNYWYPNDPDLDNPLMQKAAAIPYPAIVPLTGEDPWTPEVIMVGKRNYWRHVVVKFVEPDPDVAGSGQLVQAPKPSANGFPKKGGTNPASNLAFVEVDVTWFNSRLGKIQQVRLATLVANPNAMSNVTVCQIVGNIYDTKALPEVGPGAASAPDADDVAIAQPLVVSARNILTGEKYTTTANAATGSYSLTNLPSGAYEVLVFGAPKYLDGGFNDKNTPANEYNQTVSVTVSLADSSADDTNIYLSKAILVKIYGVFSGVDGTVGGPKTVQVYNSDFSSVPTELTISTTTNCTAGAPCWFVLNDVAWPATGKMLWKTMVVNLTDKVGMAATICADGLIASPASATDFYLGMAPPFAAGWKGCSTGCAPVFGTDCVYPGDSGAYSPMNLATNFKKPTLRVDAVEFYDGVDHPLGASICPLARIGFLSSLDGISATLGFNSDSTTIFLNLKTMEGLITIQPAPTISLKAWVTTTGYSEDSYFLPFDTNPGLGAVPPSADYDLVDGPQPIATDRYTFRFIRISTISGTVWITAGTKGYIGAPVRISLQSADWNNVVITNGQGNFFHTTIPVNSNKYLVAPIAGADYVSAPPSRLVLVDKNGLVYDKDTSGNQLEFTLTAINGSIRGVVTKGGVAVSEGAVVIASTYNGPFPSTFPSATLAGAYTYSTVTYSDGSYHLKVGTGLGNYYIYAFTKQGGLEASIAQVPVGGLAVTAGSEAVYNPAIP